MHPDQQTYGRARGAAMGGMAIQFVLAVVMAIAGTAAQTPAMEAAALHLIGGLPIWLVLILLFHQHRLERAEALEAEQLARSDARTAAMFDEHGVDLQVARRRLDFLYKWGLGLTTVAVSLYLLAVGLWKLNTALNLDLARRLVIDARGNDSFANPAYHVAIAFAIAFVAFIVARYEAGMTKVPQWQLLRGGASYLMGNFAVALLVGVGMLFALFDNDRVLAGLMLVVPALMVFQGLEMLLLLLLSAYRPRRPGEVPRPAFDSRVLGLLTSPKSLAKAVSDAINYQFGFEVSRSWFYQLLSKSFVWLLGIGVLVLFGLSSVVIVQPHEQALITRWGRIVVDKPLEPGLYFKRPWPFERAENYPTKRVYQLTVGSSRRGIKPNTPVLWTNAHTEDSKEEYLLTAATPLKLTHPTDGAATQPDDDAGTSGIGLIGAQVVVHYRIADLIKNVTTIELEGLSPWWRTMNAIAERRASAYMVSKDIDTLIGPGRVGAGEELRREIQADVDEYGLGVEVLFVGLAGVHPPSDSGVAEAFHHQVGALQEQKAAVEGARRDEIEVLGKVAGSREQALAISAAVRQWEQAKKDLDALRRDSGTLPEAVTSKEAQVKTRAAEIELLLTNARGQAAEVIYEARAYQWQRALGERAKADRFTAELKAYQAAPSLYKERRYLEVLAEGLEKRPKTIIASKQTQPPVIRIDLKEQGGFQNIVKPE